jgi:hypothetical protein
MYPTVIVDSFFKEPDSIVEYSKKLKWFKPKEKDNWPGHRTEALHLINRDLFNFIMDKIISIYYNFKVQEVNYEDVVIKFHKTNKLDIKKWKKKHFRIHKDKEEELAGVIYLNKDIVCEETGTSIYDEKLKKTIKVSNTYNTLLLYDARRFHGVTSFSSLETLRLVIFIRRLKTNLTVLQRLS